LVSTQYQSTKAYLSICDTGPGLNLEEIAKITERFYRPTDTQATGSGLGLSIVQRVVELHAGHLQITQGAQGRGLCIQVDFPVHI